MTSLMSAISRTLGMLSNGADTISTGVEHLNHRMQRYAENQLRLSEDKNAVELAQMRTEIQSEMLSLTKQMQDLSKDPVFEQSQKWFLALKEEIATGKVAKFEPKAGISVRSK